MATSRSMLPLPRAGPSSRQCRSARPARTAPAWPAPAATTRPASNPHRTAGTASAPPAEWPAPHWRPPATTARHGSPVRRWRRAHRWRCSRPFRPRLQQVRRQARPALHGGLLGGQVDRRHRHPGTFFNAFSTRITQEAQVMPVIWSLMSWGLPSAASAVFMSGPRSRAFMPHHQASHHGKVKSHRQQVYRPPAGTPDRWRSGPARRRPARSGPAP